MVRAGYHRIWEEHILGRLTEWRFSKTLSRTVTGSINDLVANAKYYVENAECTLADACDRLNATPFSALGYRFPKEVFEGIQSELADARN